MQVVRPLAGFFVLGLLLDPASSWSQADKQPARIAMRFFPPGADEEADLFRQLNDLLKPKQVLARAGSTVDQVIARECGSVRPAHRELFRKANPAVSATIGDADRIVTMPACPYWDFHATLNVPRGVVATTSIKAVMGVYGEITARDVTRVNKTAPPESPVGHAQTFDVPYVTLSTGWDIREGAGDPSSVAKTISSLAGAVFAAPDRGHVGLVRRRDSALPAGGGPACDAPADPSTWPFDRTAVENALARNQRLFGDRRKKLGLPVIVSILDVGIDSVAASRLPLHRSEYEQGRADEGDHDDNDFRNDSIGTNLVDRGGFPRAYRNYEWPEHGVAVATLAAGGVGSDALSETVKTRFGLKILSLLSPQGPDRFSMPLEALTTGMTYRAAANQMTIANLSIQSDVDIGGFAATIAPLSTLMVVAAGNDSVDVSLSSVYPARYHESFSTKLMAVAAHVPLTAGQRTAFRKREAEGDSGVLWQYSNWGDLVDLAAPGCSVPTMGLDGAAVSMSGTSFAAPLVSFAAALLVSEGILFPYRVRSRILASVDYVPGLPVWSQGILNIPKALAVFEDQVERKDGTIVRGTIAELPPFQVRGTKIPPSKVLKVIPLSADKLRLFILSERGVEFRDVANTLASIRITDSETKVVETIPISDVSDVVFAAPEYRR